VLPPYAARHPEYLTVGRNGQLLFHVQRGTQLGDAPEASGRIWFWDGKQGHELLSEDRDVFLAADGRSLIWFANTFAVVKDANGEEQSVRTSARVWRTDASGRNETTLVSVPQSPSCTRATGACSETCAEWTMWAPDGIVDQSFVLTRFIPGQLQTSYEQSVLYRGGGAAWKAAPLASPLEKILTGNASGEQLVEAVLDGGCCGWMNESSDRTAFINGGRRTVFFDEFARFGNADYDISFYSTAAALSPTGAMLAHTINTDGRIEDIRESADGKPNLAALAKIKSVMPELPITEILQTKVPSKTLSTIRHAALVGWLNDREILVVEDGKLSVYDMNGTRTRATGIAVNGAAFVR